MKSALSAHRDSMRVQTQKVWQFPAFGLRWIPIICMDTFSSPGVHGLSLRPAEIVLIHKRHLIHLS